MISPIVEYLPISHSEKGTNWELFSDAAEDGTSIHYLSEIKALMEEKHGIYIFYDSLGRAIYVGKAEKQSLWKEANLAFNRDRGANQTMWLVNHPEKNVSKVIRRRKIVQTPIQLNYIAAYFSAYDIENERISSMEAFLIRAFANNLMNKRIETIRQTETN
jgi:hypothetical protein